jgi:hypothetical protein
MGLSMSMHCRYPILSYPEPHHASLFRVLQMASPSRPPPRATTQVGVPVGYVARGALLQALRRAGRHHQALSLLCETPRKRCTVSMVNIVLAATLEAGGLEGVGGRGGVSALWHLCCMHVRVRQTLKMRLHTFFCIAF